MQTYRRWLNYDTFKLIVAIILVILLLVLPRGIAHTPAATLANGSGAPEIPQEVRAGLPQGYHVQAMDSGWAITTAGGDPLFLWDPNLKQWAAVMTSVDTAVPTAPPVVAATDVPTLPPTATPPAPTALPPTATLPPPTAVAPAPTTQPPATAEATPASTAAGATQPPAVASECGAAAPTRLEAGQSARVTSNLNLRSSAGIGDNLIRISPVGTMLKVIGGPQCVAYGGGVYRWWQVEAPDGTQGWSAEATLNGGMYFLEPLP